MTDSPHLVPKYQAILSSASNGDGVSERTISKVTVAIPKNLEGEYTGSTPTYVTLHLVDGQRVELFVKEMPVNPEHAKALPFSVLFEKEAGFFNQVLPDFRKLYLDKSLEGIIRPLNFVPKCYFADSKEIILENLVAGKGYFMHPKVERQELAQAKMVIPDLATFHALSYCIIAETGEDAFLKKYPFVKGDGIYSLENHLLSIMVEVVVLACEKLFETNKVPGSARALEIFKSYKGRVFSELRNLANPDTSSHLFKVLNHGDVWNNNILFLKDAESNSKLVHSMLVDYQGVRYGSPSLDLIYYFFTSLPYTTRRSHLRELLADYFHVFTKSVNSIFSTGNNNGDGKDKAEVFPHTFDEVVADFNAKSFIGFWFNLMYWWGEQLAAYVDFANVEGDMATFYINKVFTWISANPEKGVEIASGLVQFCEEFEELRGA